MRESVPHARADCGAWKTALREGVIRDELAVEEHLEFFHVPGGFDIHCEHEAPRLRGSGGRHIEPHLAIGARHGLGVGLAEPREDIRFGGSALLDGVHLGGVEGTATGEGAGGAAGEDDSRGEKQEPDVLHAVEHEASRKPTPYAREIFARGIWRGSGKGHEKSRREAGKSPAADEKNMQTPPSADSGPSPVPAATYASLPALTVSCPVSLVVRTPAGEEIAVEIAKFPLSKMGRYAETLADLGPFVEFVTGRPAGFADTILHEDVFRIDEVAQKLNADRLARLLRRQCEVAEWLNNSVRRAGLTG